MLAIATRLSQFLSVRRKIRAEVAQIGQCDMEYDAAAIVVYGSEIDGSRQLVSIRRTDAFTVRKDGADFRDAQHAGGQRIGIELQTAYPPEIRVHRAAEFNQPAFMIEILSLEMLRAQEQAFAPEDF